jgi:hypothetical protein
VQSYKHNLQPLFNALFKFWLKYNYKLNIDAGKNGSTKNEVSSKFMWPTYQSKVCLNSYNHYYPPQLNSQELQILPFIQTQRRRQFKKSSLNPLVLSPIGSIFFYQEGIFLADTILFTLIIIIYTALKHFRPFTSRFVK